ncbi:MAG TPA: potassium-transporting ATPase subunit KdpC, partial [Dongiaceae bacterium]
MHTRDTLQSERDTGWVAAVRAALMLILVCGGMYPLVLTVLGGTLFPHQAAGSLVVRDGTVVGSELVGQSFAAARYFHGRPSAANYDPLNAAASNRAVSNPDLRRRAEATAAEIANSDDVEAGQIPVDLIAASGSGLDPHISPASARLQIARVAAARSRDVEAISRLVEAHVELPVLG